MTLEGAGTFIPTAPPVVKPEPALKKQDSKAPLFTRSSVNKQRLVDAINKKVTTSEVRSKSKI